MNRLLKMYPNVGWNFYKVSRNPHFTMKMLVKYYDKELAWGHISRWMPLTIEFVKKHPEYKWDYALLSANPSLILNDILENTDISWRLDFFSSNVNLPLWYVRENMDLPWNWYNISCNKGITMMDIHENIDLPWNWLGVSYNVNITIEFLENHPELPILWGEAVSEHMKIDVNILSKHSDKNWDYKKILNNSHLTIDILRYLVSKNIMNDRYIWLTPTRNPAISIQDIESNNDLPWKMNSVSSNPNFSLEDFDRYVLRGKSVNLNDIVKNADAKIDNVYESIIENMDSIITKLMTHFPVKFGVGSNRLNYFLAQKKKIWKSISANPNITIAFVKKYAPFIDFNVLSSNKFKLFDGLRERTKYFYLLKKVNGIPLDITVSLVSNFL